MKWMPVISILYSTFLLSACGLNHTDVLESHEIIASPANRWIHWHDTVPLDVTEAKIKTHHDCPSAPSD